MLVAVWFADEEAVDAEEADALKLAEAASVVAADKIWPAAACSGSASWLPCPTVSATGETDALSLAEAGLILKVECVIFCAAETVKTDEVPKKTIPKTMESILFCIYFSFLGKYNEEIRGLFQILLR